MPPRKGIIQGEINPADLVQLRQFTTQVAALFDLPRRVADRFTWAAEDIDSKRTLTGRIVDRLKQAQPGVFSCRLITQDSTTRAAVNHASDGFTKGQLISNSANVTDFITDPDGEFAFDVAIAGAVTIVPVFTVLGEGTDAASQSWV